MTLWIIFAALTAGLLAALLRPLLAGASPCEPSAAAQELAVYRDQLAELERDAARGAIPAAEADAARAEVSRRLLAAATAAEAEKPVVAVSTPVRRGVALASVILVPLAAIALYAAKGRPDLPAVPHAERLANAEKNGDMPALVAKIEDHLRQHPDDLRGWQLLVPVYLQARRYEDAIHALKVLAAKPTASSHVFADLGEVLTIAGRQPTIPQEALDAFREALKRDPKDAKARYYSALAIADTGDRAGAKAALEALKADAPADAPWLQIVEQQIAALDAPAAPAATGMPQLSADQMAAAQNMTPEERMAMIRSMVDGLDQRLAANGKDIDGWLRLARARMMLGEKDKAQAALDSAAKNYDGDTDALARIDQMRQALARQ